MSTDTRIVKEIKNREDVSLLVHTFYDKIRQDDLLGPIFNYHIAEDLWPPHLEKLTDFWMTNLFGVRAFKGNPTLAHVKVDKAHNHQISQVHFGRWLQLWFETIDSLFDGDNAFRAKNSARKMGTGQFLAMWNSRPKEQKGIE